MNKSNVNEASVVMSPIYPGKEFKWSIEFDEHLRALLDSEGIEDRDDQMIVCDVLCRIGLAEHRLFGENTDTIHSQEHHYSSTKKMRKLAEKCQL
jgi:hypothetical protein